MSNTSSNTSFFSFGPEDSFVSKSSEGLRYRNLPPALQQLIAGGSVIDVHWAALGPVRESWVLSFKDASGKCNLAWGAAIPTTLQSILKTLTPTQHLRVFLGHQSISLKEYSFIAWDPSFIRWHALPSTLESCIQSWLTPSGWKSGAPRSITWSTKGACFAISEYGEVVVRMGLKGPEEDDTPFMDTVREWGEESGFKWSDVAYLNLDSSKDSDQFIAIRKDGTWAGSIDSDANEEALEAFALRFFARSKPAKSSNSKARAPAQSNGTSNTKAKIRPQPQQQKQNTNHDRKPNNDRSRNQSNNYANGNTTSNGIPPAQPANVNTIPDATSQSLYERWATETATMLAQALVANNAPSPSPTPNPTATSRSRTRPPKKIQIRSSSSSLPTTTAGGKSKLLTTFPYLPPALTSCQLPYCVSHKADSAGLRACKHDVERLLRASGLWSYEWLRQERIRWHPDRFGRLCEEDFREQGRRLAEEMFKIVDGLVGSVEAGR